MHGRHTHSGSLVVPWSERRHFGSREAAVGGKYDRRGGRRGGRRIGVDLRQVLSGGAACGSRPIANRSRRIRTPPRPHSHRASGRPAPPGEGPLVSRPRRRSASCQIRRKIKELLLLIVGCCSRADGNYQGSGCLYEAWLAAPRSKVGQGRRKGAPGPPSTSPAV